MDAARPEDVADAVTNAMFEPLLFDDPVTLARHAAIGLTTHAARAIHERGVFRLGLSGGRSPEPLYRELAGPMRDGVDWTRVQIFFADERDAPPTEPESNYWMVRKLLIEPAGIPPANVHRMRADATDLEAAAGEYDRQLAEPLDLLILGLGEDGHIASIFPGSPLVEERIWRVAAVFDSPKPPPRRLTITPRVIDDAGHVVVIATGAEKAAAVARVLAPAGSPRDCPARLLGGRTWFLDRAALAPARPVG